MIAVGWRGGLEPRAWAPRRPRDAALPKYNAAVSCVAAEGEAQSTSCANMHGLEWIAGPGMGCVFW